MSAPGALLLWARCRLCHLLYSSSDGPSRRCSLGEKTSYMSVRGLESCQKMYWRPQNGPCSPNSLHKALGSSYSDSL